MIFIDGTQFTPEDNNFADLEHLNQIGATNFTRWFDLEFQKIYKLLQQEKNHLSH